MLIDQFQLLRIDLLNNQLKNWFMSIDHIQLKESLINQLTELARFTEMFQLKKSLTDQSHLNKLDMLTNQSIKIDLLKKLLKNQSIKKELPKKSLTDQFHSSKKDLLRKSLTDHTQFIKISSSMLQLEVLK